MARCSNIGGESYAPIPLTQNQFAQVDDADFDWLMQWKWFATKRKNTFYAKRNPSKLAGHSYMHIAIMGTKIGFHVDHIDHDGLNNQASNLRVCTPQQNFRYKDKPIYSKKKLTSKYKGVYFYKRDKKYCAELTLNRKNIRLGKFLKETDAAIAYNEGANKYFGEFALLNIIPPVNNI